MPDLAAIVITLRPTHQGEIPAWLGYAAQAWFLESLDCINPEVAAAVHDSEGLKPFTVSNLQSENNRSYPQPNHARDGLLRLHPSQVYTLRVTTLDSDLTTLALNGLVPMWLDQGLTLHDQRFCVEQIVTDCDINPWSGTADYVDILKRHTTGPDRRSQGRRLSFTFATPTSFNKTGGLQMPLPLPELVFGSLITRWTRYSRTTLHPDLLTLVKEQVVISYHRLHSTVVSFERSARGSVTAFTGDVTYTVQSADSFWLGQLAVLADYAKYAGLGVRTAMGMGAVRAANTSQATNIAKGDYVKTNIST